MNNVVTVSCQPLAKDVDDFYRLFAKSEALITHMAASRRTAEQISRFEAVIVEIETQLNGDPSGVDLRALNRKRYEAIHAMASSKIAGELVANMWDRSDFYIRVAYGEFVYSSAVHATGKKIARAIIAGDADTAAQQTETYLLRVGSETAATLGSHQKSV